METRHDLYIKTNVLRHYLKKYLTKSDLSPYQFSQANNFNHVTIHKLVTGQHKFLYPHNVDKLYKFLVENKLIKENINWEKEFSKLKLIF